MKLEKFKQRDPKKVGISIFTVVSILLIAGVFFYTSFASFEINDEFNIIEGSVGDNGDLYFAFYIDDEISSRMPQKGEGYILNTQKTTCTKGASVEFNETEWSVKVVNMTTTHTKCTLYFEKTAARYIKDLEEGTTSLVYDETTDNNLRYIGTNPNNYVSFNNELWRIIGVFNNIDDGTGKKETRLKIIKNEPYAEEIRWFDGTYSITTPRNDWTTTSLQTELNETYLNSIVSPYQEMIENTLWPLGGVGGYAYLTVNMFYESERGSEIYSGNATEWTGKIALMYPSDYGYATGGGPNISRETCLETYADWDPFEDDCITHNWLYKDSYTMWTLTPYTETSYNVFYIERGIIYTDQYSQMYFTAFPALYLDSNVKINWGEGTESNPYQLSL